MSENIEKSKEISSSTSTTGATGAGGLDKLYKNWFLDYASYVILDRAIPSIDDGLKPVQRRILYALHELDDGRYNKAANVIGHCMRYHPHGDMAISDAMVKLAQKDLLIDTQGNWGNPITGDRSAASRYIEARLSEFAKEVVFNPETTSWQMSYDGRKKEPIHLPIKFPLLLAQGVEGIAVGLSTKILPHNFCELLKESIAILRGYKPQILPDFPTGGSADFSQYKDGKKGGKVKVRAVIKTIDPKTLVINEIPFGTTTHGLIDSILSAMDKGQIKIKKLQDNTSKDVEIRIHLPTGASPEKTIRGLYAFTDCEISISPNCCIIEDDKPIFTSVSHVLKMTTFRTKELLEAELKIALGRIQQKIHAGILEQLFIDHKIYRKIETCNTWDEVKLKIRKNLMPFEKEFLLELRDKDIELLTDIKIRRITKFNRESSEAQLAKYREEMVIIKKNLANLNDFAIAYFKNLLKKYGGSKKRLTSIETFASVDAAAVIEKDQKLFVNRKEGFLGTGLKQDEYLFDCSKLDEILAICEDGSFKVSKLSPKNYYGKNILRVEKFKKNDHRCIYHLIYLDGKSGNTYAKRFTLLSATRDKVYQLTKGHPGSQILYLSVNHNGESEKVKIKLKPKSGQRNNTINFDFTTLSVKNRSVVGTLVTDRVVSSVSLEKKGASTLAAQRIWFDRVTGKLNYEGFGLYIGKFEANDKLIAIFQSGIYEIFSCSQERVLSNDLIEIRKYDNSSIISAIYIDGTRKEIYVKRLAISDCPDGCKNFIPNTKGTQLLLATMKAHPTVQAEFDTKKNKSAPTSQKILLEEFIDVKGINALGNKLSEFPVKKLKMLD